MTWKILVMFAVKFLMIFRGSKSTTKFPAVEVNDANQLMGTWCVACYIAHPFQSRLNKLKYQLVQEDNRVRVIQHGYNQRKKKQLALEISASFKESSKLGWFDIEVSNPYQQQLKFIYLSEDGSQAVVVGPTMNTVKILYRNPDFTKLELDRLISHIDELGFKTKKLIRMEQG